MRIGKEDGILDMNKKIRYRIETLRKIFSDEMTLTKIAESMVPHIETMDKYGHSEHVGFRVHPLMSITINDLYAKHSIKFPHKSDYLRYLLFLGMIIDQKYWEIAEDAEENINLVLDVQKYHSQILTKQQREELMNQLNTIKKEKLADNIKKKIETLEKIIENDELNW